MQTNVKLDNDTREVIYNLLFTMFQSYRFKQYLTLSLTANYKHIIRKTENSEHDISSIGVQVFTSDELSMLIYKHAELRNNILNELYMMLGDVSKGSEDDLTYYAMW